MQSILRCIYKTFRCQQINVAAKRRHLVRLPTYFTFHKVRAHNTTLNQMILMDDVVFKLVSFIEYVGCMPKKCNIKTTEGIVAHYILYKEIGLPFVHHDDSVAHVAEVEEEYKIRLAFYRNMRDCQRAQLNIDLDGLPVGRKPIVVRAPFKDGTDKSKANKRHRNKSRKRKRTSSSAKDQPCRKSHHLNPSVTPPPSEESEDESITAKGTLDILYLQLHEMYNQKYVNKFHKCLCAYFC